MQGDLDYAGCFRVFIEGPPCFPVLSQALDPEVAGFGRFNLHEVSEMKLGEWGKKSVIVSGGREVSEVDEERECAPKNYSAYMHISWCTWPKYTTSTSSRIPNITYIVTKRIKVSNMRYLKYEGQSMALNSWRLQFGVWEWLAKYRENWILQLFESVQ